MRPTVTAATDGSNSLSHFASLASWSCQDELPGHFPVANFLFAADAFRLCYTKGLERLSIARLRNTERTTSSTGGLMVAMLCR